MDRILDALTDPLLHAIIFGGLFAGLIYYAS